MLGVLSFDSVRTERDWPDELVERLRLLSEAFAGALERKCMESALAERLRFQRLLSDLSARFANVPALDFDQAVRGAFPGHGRAGNSWSLQGTTDMASIPWPRGGALAGGRGRARRPRRCDGRRRARVVR